MENYLQYKLKLKDISLADAWREYKFCQHKYDGFWTALDIREETMAIVTSGGEIREMREFPEPKQIWPRECGRTILLAEWLFGTTWGDAHRRDTGHEFVVFDCVMIDGEDVSGLPYSERHDYALSFVENFGGDNMVVAKLYPVIAAEWLMENKYFEGLVFRNDDGFGNQVARLKHTFTMDYVYMGYNAGGGKYEGTVGSLIGGLYVNGDLKAVCSVGGLTDSMREFIKSEDANLRGSVFEASGKKLFASGALRHPAFLRWRDDKAAVDCLLT